MNAQEKAAREAEAAKEKAEAEAAKAEAEAKAKREAEEADKAAIAEQQRLEAEKRQEDEKLRAASEKKRQELDAATKAMAGKPRPLRPGLVRLEALKTCNGGGVMVDAGLEFVVNTKIAERLVKKGFAKVVRG